MPPPRANENQLHLGLFDGITPGLFPDLIPGPDLPRQVEHHRSAAHRRLDDHPQTRLKLAAWRAYVRDWLRILGQLPTSTDVWIIDAFAGPGTYPDAQDSRGWSEGSPLIACDVAEYMARWLAGRGHPVRIHLRFIERRASTARTLANALVPYRGRVDIRVIPGRAEHELPMLLRESRGHPTLVFLDPDGFRQLTFDMVGSLRGRKYTEVLLSFDLQGVIRTAGLKDSSTVTSFYGDDMWRILRSDDGSIDLDKFLEGYRQRLGTLFPFTSVKRIVFTREHANRVIAQGCGSIKGIKVWREAFASAQIPEDVQVLDIVAEVDARTQIDAALAVLPMLAGQEVTYGRIAQKLGGLDLANELLDQALLFLRHVGFTSWTASLNARSRPAPRFSFATQIPQRLSWDGVIRAHERAVREVDTGA